MIRGIFLLLLVVSAALCPLASAQDAEQDNPPMQSAANDTDTDLVIARVSGRPITEKQLLWAIERIALQKRLPLNQRQKRYSLFFKEGLKDLIMVAAIRNQAEQENIVLDSAKIDEEMRLYKKDFHSEEEFEQTLKRQGLTEAELRDSMEEGLIVREMLNRASKDFPRASDEEISNFYDKNQERFPVPGQVRASHILVRVDPQSTPEQEAEAKKKLESVRADIQARKISFSEAAVKYSEDRSTAQTGGDLGFFTRGEKSKPLESTAFSMRPGEVSQIVETEDGYHLILVTESRPSRNASLEEVKPMIIQLLNRESEMKVRQKYVDDLVAKTSVETFMTQEEFVKRHSEK